MKRNLFGLLALIASMPTLSQNIQLHYDMGHTFYEDLTPRQSVTTTVECMTHVIMQLNVLGKGRH